MIVDTELPTASLEGPQSEVLRGQMGALKTLRRGAALGWSVLREATREVVKRDRYSVTVIDSSDQEELQEAQRFIAVRYLELGKVGKEDIDESSGVLLQDKQANDCIYFAIYDNKLSKPEMVAVTTIFWNKGLTIDDLVDFPLDQLPEKSRAELRQLPAGSVADLGRETKRDRTVEDVVAIKLLRGVFEYCLKNGVTTLVCGLQPKVYAKYSIIFGHALKKLSDDYVKFEGFKGGQVPLAIDVENCFINQKDGTGDELELISNGSQSVEEDKARKNRVALSMGQRAINRVLRWGVRNYFASGIPDLKK